MRRRLGRADSAHASLSGATTPTAMITAALVSSNPVVGVMVAIVLFALGRLVIHRVVRAEQNPWLSKILTWSLVLHLLAAPAQI